MSERTLPGRLTIPSTVDPRDVNWIYAVPLVVIHLLALSALVPSLFTWTGFVVFFLGTYVYGVSITLCYHRLLAHGSFAVPKWLERTFVVVALCSLEDTPAQWVATHRMHHANSDKEDDPHSPLVTFFWGHMGWLFVRNKRMQNAQALQKYARNVAADPFYLYLEKHRMVEVWIYLVHVAIYYLAGLGAGLLAGMNRPEAAWFGLSIVVWGVLARNVVVWHITWSVNSLTHMFGYRNYGTKDNSRNNWLVAVLASGEGWHNNHHHDPAACTVRHRWWEIDVTFLFIKFMQRIGLASDIVPPRHQRRAEVPPATERQPLPEPVETAATATATASPRVYPRADDAPG